MGRITRRRQLAFTERFVFMSGSLQALATAHGRYVSDHTTSAGPGDPQVSDHEDQQIVLDFKRVLLTKCADGTIDGEKFRTVFAIHRIEMENRETHT